MAQTSALVVESDYFIPSSKITVLINTIAKMSKNATVESELSQVLDEFLEKLGECDKYLQNGIFNMNFAEAALLLQSSADLYSKKVDMLWDIIFDYQKRLLLSEEQSEGKSQEIEKVEERKRKYKRKRKTNADESQTAKLVNNFSFGNVDNIDYLNQNCETVNLSQEWEKFHIQNATCDSVEPHILNKSFIFLPNNPIHSDDNDYIGRYDQFHSMSLTDEIFHLESQKLLSDDHNCITNMRIDSYVINDFLRERSIPSNVPLETYSKQLKEYINNFFESNRQPEKPQSSQTMLNLCKMSRVSLERLPDSLVRDKLRRASLADSLFDDDHMEAEICASPCNVLSFSDPKNCDNQINKNLESRSKSCSQDSAFFEDEEQAHNEDSEADFDSALDISAESMVTLTVNDSVVEPTSVAQETVANDLSQATNVKTVDSSGEVDGITVVHSIDASAETTEIVESSNLTAETLVKNGQQQGPTVTTRNKPAKKWSSLLDDSLDKAEEIKRRKVVKKVRISAKALQKLATGITVKYRDFEVFCRQQYRAAQNEGVIPSQLSSDLEESDEEPDDNADDDEEASPFHSEEETSDHEDRDDGNCEEPEKEDEEPGIPSSPRCTSTDLPRITSPDFNLPSCSKFQDSDVIGMTSTPHRTETLPNPSFVMSEAELEQEDVLRKSVREWRSFILPKLKSLQNRADFDIHEYGSKIIGPSQIGEQRDFKEIVKGKSAAEVSRYFIATLQLANTYNVEITGALPGEVANDTFQIKTLDKTKHHELLEEYQAPSEESFRERLEKAKAMNPRVALHEPPNKKLKLGDYSRKRLF